MDTRTILHSEVGGFHKRRGEISVCLVYPNTYEVGMANLGFQLVWRILNQTEGVVCERAFMDTGSGRAMESGRRLNQFDVLSFSLSYELDFLNRLRILRAAHIPPHSDNRHGHPLLIIGGIAAFANPLPYSSFFDLMYIGEAEPVLSSLITSFKTCRERQVFLNDASETQGIWVPSLPQRTVRKVVVHNLDDIDTCAPCVSPFAHFSNMLLAEVERGCPFRCRFCLATQAYRPYRTKSPGRLLEEIGRVKKRQKSIGLIGAAISEVPDLSQLIHRLLEFTDNVGVSSLRLDKIDTRLLKTLVEVGLKTITIAPEAGTDKLRHIINKRITNEKILQLGADARSLGVRRIKLYFMVGLPFETEEDLVGIVNLVKNFRRVYAGEVVISVNPFVPKAHTPFQYHPMESRKNLSHKLHFVKEHLRRVGYTKVVTKSAKEAVLQAMLSMGDSRVGEALLEVVDAGVDWGTAFRKVRIHVEDYIGEKPTDRFLPWEFIDFGVDKKELVKSYNEAKKLSQEKSTSNKRKNYN